MRAVTMFLVCRTQACATVDMVKDPRFALGRTMGQFKRLTIGHHKVFKAATLAPAAPFWAVGDVHGRYDLLAPLLDKLLALNEPVVLLGDYINKGPQSADVLRLIKAACATGQVTALRGNHEDLLLRFLERPRIETETMIRFGGIATFESFGVTGLSADLTLKQRSKIRDSLLSAMAELPAWLTTLPYVLQSGNIVAMHAGADPLQPLALQPQAGFAWGHPRFVSTARQDGIWVVHGHHPVPAVEIKNGRISLETQCVETGALSAVRISKGAVESLKS
jgi:serine/threonine protein phosphatase 1